MCYIIVYYVMISLSLSLYIYIYICIQYYNYSVLYYFRLGHCKYYNYIVLHYCILNYDLEGTTGVPRNGGRE